MTSVIFYLSFTPYISIFWGHRSDRHRPCTWQNASKPTHSTQESIASGTGSRSRPWRIYKSRDSSEIHYNPDTRLKRSVSMMKRVTDASSNLYSRWTTRRRTYWQTLIAYRSTACDSLTTWLQPTCRWTAAVVGENKRDNSLSAFLLRRTAVNTVLFSKKQPAANAARHFTRIGRGRGKHAAVFTVPPEQSTV